MSYEEEASVINIVEDKDPLPLLLITQPVVDKLKYIRPQIAPAGNFEVVCDIPVALLKAGGVARMYPENPCLC